MITDTDKQGPISQRPRRRFVTCVLLGLVLLATWLIWRGGQRVSHVVQETKQVRLLKKDLANRQEVIVKTPARKALTDGFLQMAFGGNPALLAQIHRLLNAHRDSIQGDVSMVLVTFRGDGGVVRDVAVQFFGNLKTWPPPPGSAMGLTLERSFETILGRDVLIYAEPEVAQRQRALCDALRNSQTSAVEQYLEQPVSFVAVVPEPGRLFAQHLRPYIVALVMTGTVSLQEARGEMVAMSFDPKQASALAEMLRDTRLVGVSAARLKFNGGAVDLALQPISQAKIEAQGPSVFIRGSIAKEAIADGLPRVIQVLSKGFD